MPSTWDDYPADLATAHAEIRDLRHQLMVANIAVRDLHTDRMKARGDLLRVRRQQEHYDDAGLMPAFAEDAGVWG